MAPEVMCAQNHTIAVDYFALGVFTYEFMFGIRPYTGKSRKEIKDKIMAKQVQIKTRRGREILIIIFKKRAVSSFLYK